MDPNFFLRNPQARDTLNNISGTLGKISSLLPSLNKNSGTSSTIATPPSGSLGGLIGGISKERNALNDALGPELIAPNENDIVEAERQRSEAIANLITQQFNTIIGNARQAGNERSQVTAAQNRASGLAGSNVADAASLKTAQENEAVLQTYRQERDAKIAELLLGVKERGTAEYLKKRALFLDENRDRVDRVNAFNEKVRDRVVNEVASIAQTGTSYDQFRSEAGDSAIKQLLEDSGYSEAGLKALFLSNKPASTEIYNERVGSKQVIGYRDPITGEVTQETIDLPGSGWQFQNVGGKPYFVNEELGVIRRADTGEGSDSGNKVPTLQEYISAAEQVARQTLTPEARADLERQYNTEYGGKAPSYEGSEFTNQELRKLEQAGLLGASRSEQLDYLYSKKDDSSRDTGF